MGELTSKQQQVLDELRRAGGDYMTPTQIGTACGKSYDRASSWANGALRQLESKGLAQRKDPGAWAATQEALDG